MIQCFPIKDENSFLFYFLLKIDENSLPRVVKPTDEAKQNKFKKKNCNFNKNDFNGLYQNWNISGCRY